MSNMAPSKCKKIYIFFYKKYEGILLWISAMQKKSQQAFMFSAEKVKVIQSSNYHWKKFGKEYFEPKKDF